MNRPSILALCLLLAAGLFACSDPEALESPSDVGADMDADGHVDRDGDVDTHTTYTERYLVQDTTPEYRACTQDAFARAAERQGAPVALSHMLRSAASCDEALGPWKAAILADASLPTDLAECEVLYPYECRWEEYTYDYYGWADAMEPMDTSSGVDPDPIDAGASEYSTTNVQEVGVDEADFIKNDGTYIYTLADGHFWILDAWPPEQAHVVSTTPIEGDPRRMFVHQGKAVIYSAMTTMEGTYPNRECTYGYDCEFVGEGVPLRVTVLDLLDVTAPVVVREVTFDSSYLAARRIGDFVYTVVQSPDPDHNPLPTIPAALQEYRGRCSDEPMPFSAAEVRAMFEALRQDNLAQVASWGPEAMVPHVEDVRIVDGQWVTGLSPFANCEDYRLAQTGDGADFLSIVSFDLSAQGPLEATTIVARPGAVYASQQALYIAQRHYGWQMTSWFAELENEPEATTIHKFLLSAAEPATTYLGSGLVKGRVLNQFAMSEYEGNLRVATTTGYLPSPDVHNTVTVLQESAGELVQIGQLDGLAPGEDIRSVRFDGERGFLVTFKKTDPLFAFDLSDPTAPAVLGELKIPGYSTYMHFLDRDHILSIGFDAQDEGDFAWFQGILLQIFDVTDLSAPSLLHREVIGTRGSTSEAATNHLAFNYFAPKSMLAVPIVKCEASSGGSDYGDEMTFNGLMVYEATVDGGFVYQGGIPHDTVDTVGTYQACGTWWSASTSPVKRSIFMDDYVFSVAETVIKAASLAALDTPVATISLEIP